MGDVWLLVLVLCPGQCDLSKSWAPPWGKPDIGWSMGAMGEEGKWCWSSSSPWSRWPPSVLCSARAPQGSEESLPLGASFHSLPSAMLLHQNTVPSDAPTAVVWQVPGNPPPGNIMSITWTPDVTELLRQHFLAIYFSWYFSVILLKILCFFPMEKMCLHFCQNDLWRDRKQK